MTSTLQSKRSNVSTNVLNNTWDESYESEIPYNTVFHPGTEPNNDPQTGADCSASEIVDNPVFTQHSAFYYYYNPVW